MVYIASIGKGIPPYEMTQNDVKAIVQEVFKDNRALSKLMPIFDHAQINTRQFAVEKDWYLRRQGFEGKNRLYLKNAVSLSLQAIDKCLEATGDMIDYADIDAIVYVSSSGIATPSLDAYIMNERDFKEDTIRMPLWGLGCAGGAIGLSRASDWLKANPQSTAIVVCCELCSTTFQHDDQSVSNIVGTALFGDGASCALLIGENSPFKDLLPDNLLSIKGSSSMLMKNSLDIMGWNVKDSGFDVIFSKDIPKLVPSIWKGHLVKFLQMNKLELEDLSTIIAHPGGRKVLEAMKESLDVKRPMLSHSYEVLRNHGNMSSCTVIYVLDNWMQSGIHTEGRRAVLSSLGPGFSSEMMLMEGSS